MPSPDYNNIQIIVAAREVEQQIGLLLKQQFPELLERAAVAVTGSASFGAADEFSDFDATVFLPDDDYPQWGEQLSQSLAELPSSHWAEVQDPDVHFCAMSYGKPWGMPLPSGAPERVDYKQICPETAWHFSRYVTLYDEGGHLERAKSIASGYPPDRINALATSYLGSAALALREWDEAPGPLSRWTVMADVLCDLMRHELLSIGELFPHEKWLWWWFARHDHPVLEDLTGAFDAVGETAPADVIPTAAMRFRLEVRDLPPSRDGGDTQRLPATQALWRDLWWQDNCLYHDIMRGHRVAAFIRVARCLHRVHHFCTLLLEAAGEGERALDDLKSCPSPIDSISRHLDVLAGLAAYTTWRYQIGYVIDMLRDKLVGAGVISRQTATQPWLPGD